MLPVGNKLRIDVQVLQTRNIIMYNVAFLPDSFMSHVYGMEGKSLDFTKVIVRFK